MKKLYLLIFLLGLLWGDLNSQTIGLIFNTPQSYNGYTLFCPSSSRTTYLIDNCGKLIHTWESDYTPGQAVYLLEDGSLLRTCRIGSNFNAGGSGGRIERHSWEGELLWSYNYSSTTFHQHHDIEPLPNGNLLIIAWDLKTPTEAEAVGRQNPNNNVWAERIVEVEMVGTDGINVVWEWYLWDHLIQDFDATKENYGVIADHPELVDINTGVNPGGGGPGGGSDWIHFNSVSYDPVHDRIIVSSRNLNEIWVIDHSTATEEAAGHTGGNSGKGGDLLYRWGNPLNYDRGTTTDQTLFGQHNAQFIGEGLEDEGKIIVFNNGQGRPEGNYSSVDIFEPPYDLNNQFVLVGDESFGPLDNDWIYTASQPNQFYSSRISGAQRLPNGNTLICEGTKGHFFEIDYFGNLIWEYVSPIVNGGPVSQGTIIDNNDVFRATRYGEDYLAFEGKDLTPGEPIELNPNPYDCDIVSSTSEVFTYDIQIESSLFRDELSLSKTTTDKFKIQVFNKLGQLIWNGAFDDNRININTNSWPAGFYAINIFGLDRKNFVTFKTIKQ